MENSIPHFTLHIVHEDNPFKMKGVLYYEGDIIGEYTPNYYGSPIDPSFIESWASNHAHLFKKYSSAQWTRKHILKIPVDPKDFTVSVEHYQWSCGDGCCSDSGYRGKILYKDEEVADWDEWRYCSTREYFMHKVEEWLKKHLGEDIDMTKVNIHHWASDEGEWDDELGYAPRIEYEDY